MMPVEHTMTDMTLEGKEEVDWHSRHVDIRTAIRQGLTRS